MSVVFRNNRDLSPIQAQSLTLEESNIPLPHHTHSLYSMNFSFLKHKLAAVFTSWDGCDAIRILGENFTVQNINTWQNLIWNWVYVLETNNKFIYIEKIFLE